MAEMALKERLFSNRKLREQNNKKMAAIGRQICFQLTFMSTQPYIAIMPATYSVFLVEENRNVFVSHIFT